MQFAISASCKQIVNIQRYGDCKMSLGASALVVASLTTIYPGKAANLGQIEAVTDRGPILEIIVRCPTGTAIMTYSKIEKVFCTPQIKCSVDRNAVIRRSCGG